MSYLYLITLFPTTLIPASVLGLSITTASILCGASIGDLVDRLPRLRLARCGILVQKTCQSLVFASFFVLFGPLREACRTAWGAGQIAKGQDPREEVAVYAVLLFAVVCAATGRLATTLMDISVDRDW